MTGFDIAALPVVKFDDEHREPTLFGDKTATVRYGDAGEGIEVGDPFVAADPDGVPWAVLTARAVVECTVATAALAIEAFGARYPHDHPAAIAVNLEQYYDETIELYDDVRVIIWGPPYV